MTRNTGSFIQNRKFILSTLALAFLLMSSGIFAQDGPPKFDPIGQFSVAFSTALPKGEFENNLDNNGFGINVNGSANLGKSPFALGLELAYLQYGSETRNVPFSLTIPDVTVDVTTSNNIVQAFALLRAQNPHGVLRPYVDGLVGFNYLYTETKIEDEDNIDDDDVVASSKNFDDFAFSYGFGGGVMVKLYEAAPSLGEDGHYDRPASILLDLRVRYLLGGEAEYLRRGDIERVNGEVIISPVQSKTDLLTFNIGISVAF
ncbi:MAG TPA: outer membrane beta-barrel protein [Calditrichia bacterium]|nr:outer membrane beta-barrel protein [Calditrichota bacterium]HQU71735.1 outer membrane beta-barrel protein [Calditrichia bacterium]HQV30723.1 outer membrane beta-barrel protein [Calditrichia bacterium]